VLSPVFPADASSGQFFVEPTQLLQLMDERSLVFVLPAIREGCQPVPARHRRRPGDARSTQCHRALLPQSTQTTMRRFWSHGPRESCQKSAVSQPYSPVPTLAHRGSRSPTLNVSFARENEGRERFLLLNARIPDLAARFPPLKDVLESDCHIHERAFHRTFGHLIDPGKLRFFDGVEVAAQRQREIGLPPASYCCCHSATAQFKVKRAVKAARAKEFACGARWMEPDLVRFDHRLWLS
jgi:hypothetical protein